MSGQHKANGTGPASSGGPVSAGIDFPDPADTLGPLELPATWQTRADVLEALLRALALARGNVVQVYATAYVLSEGTDARRQQAAKLEARAAQLCADRLHARVAAYKLLLDVARDRDRLMVAAMLADESADTDTLPSEDGAPDA